MANEVTTPKKAQYAVTLKAYLMAESDEQAQTLAGALRDELETVQGVRAWIREIAYKTSTYRTI